MMSRRALLVVLIVFAGLAPAARTQAGEHPIVSVEGEGEVTLAGPASTDTSVTNTLRALARLHEFGYTINTPARAERAIRHWQKVNGLTVDGIIGPETLSSLDMTTGGATATAPAARTAPPVPAADDGMPETIIRDVWPDELEDRAVAIATRESRLVPTARNACCYGLFQIHWTAHRDWLARIGVTDSIQLLDARTNTIAAYALYQLDGWAPWSL
jgi:hypothetical protein